VRTRLRIVIERCKQQIPLSSDYFLRKTLTRAHNESAWDEQHQKTIPNCSAKIRSF
jgi:hypothetical protein